MIIPYFQYHEMDQALEEFVDRVNELRYRYYASELLDKFAASPYFNLETEVRKAIAICKLADIPVYEHFNCIYRYGPSGVARDWKLSELACSFIIVCHVPEDERVKEIQEAFIRSLGL